MSVLNFVKSREIGLGRTSRRSVKNWALAQIVKDRWMNADRKTVLKDATELLGRTMSLWEALALDHLLASIDCKNCCQESYVPRTLTFRSDLRDQHIKFTDILEIIFLIGFDLNRTDSYGNNVLTFIFETCGAQRDVKEAVACLVGHGLDINRLGNAVLLEFKQRLHKLGILGNDFLCKVCNVLLGAGMMLQSEVKCNSLQL